MPLSFIRTFVNSAPRPKLFANTNTFDISLSSFLLLRCLGLIVSVISASSFVDRVYRSVVKWCLDNSISSQVTTPVTSQDLASALIAALESNTANPVSAPNDVVFDILLAEDNLVNQKLAVKILEKYGHSVEIAENGSLAVDAFKQRVQLNKQFDIILVRILLVVIHCPLLTLSLLDGRIDAFHGRHGGH